MKLHLDRSSVSTGDVSDLPNWQPSNLTDVFVQISFDIGPLGETRADTFQAIIATPEGVRRAIDMYGERVADRGLLVFKDYSWNAVILRLERIVNQSNRKSWYESLNCLQRYFLWEYEDDESVM